jgi:CRP/FNR family transcriptional regulator, cyclic AMP receptor protein
MHVDGAIDDLRRSALFGVAGPASLRILASRAYVRRFAAGQIVFTEGEPSEHLYVVRGGRVRIFVASPHGDELTLTVLTAGDSIGELSIIDEQPRSASAAAVEATELLTIGADSMRAALTAEPALLWTVAGELATTVRRLTGSAADLVFLDLPRRLAKLIVAEATAGDDGARHVELGMSQAGIAARLGVTRQSLNRALTGLVRRGWISVRGHGFVIDDLASLSRFADS